MTDEKYILELSSIDDWDWDECREYLVPCPNCGDVLKLEISPCTDTECCGIEHRISCENEATKAKYPSQQSGYCFCDERWDLEGLILDHINPGFRDEMMRVFKGRGMQCD